MLTQADYTQPIEYYTEPIQHAPIVLKSFVMINSLSLGIQSRYTLLGSV